MKNNICIFVFSLGLVMPTLAYAQSRTSGSAVGVNAMVQGQCVDSVSRLEEQVRELEAFATRLQQCNDSNQTYAGGPDCVDLAALDHEWDDLDNPTELQFFDRPAGSAAVPVGNAIAVIVGIDGANAECEDGYVPVPDNPGGGPDPDPVDPDPVDPEPEPEEPAPLNIRAGCYVDTSGWDDSSMGDCDSEIATGCTNSNGVVFSVGDIKPTDYWRLSEPRDVQWSGDCSSTSVLCMLDDVPNGTYTATATVRHNGDVVFTRTITATKMIRDCDDGTLDR